MKVFTKKGEVSLRNRAGQDPESRGKAFRGQPAGRSRKASHRDGTRHR